MTATRRPTLFAMPLVGWKEYVKFPRLKLGPIVAKIDTGARTSALHADMIEVEGRRVHFSIGRKRFAAPLAGYKRVRSSNGISELRAVIRATLELGTVVMKTEITLTDRTVMDVPMLLGRNSIKGHFVVHAAKTFLLTRRLQPS
jgi:hypothetical protein